MKNGKILLIALFSGVMCSCSQSGGETDSHDTITADSIVTVQSDSFCLEKILTIGTEDELKKAYGGEHVRFDTIWGAEGMFTTGTVISFDSSEHVEVIWHDEELRKGIISATLVSHPSLNSRPGSDIQWRSCTGIRVGMSLEELQKINGRAFTFMGFEWDYAGTLSSWNGGTLDGKGISVQMSYPPSDIQLSPEENRQIVGDIVVNSENAVARKLNTYVWAISVARIAPK